MPRVNSPLIRAALAALLLAFPFAFAARAADDATIDLGIKVYKGSSECLRCHGWNGKGGPPDDTPGREPGGTLLSTKLTRAEMIELFSCGTAGGRMPQFLAEAWTEKHRCGGKVLFDLATDEIPERPYSMLSAEEIAAVADFVIEFYQGKTMTLAKCIRINGPDSRLCELLR